MQMNEELIKKIVDAVMAEIGQLEHKTETKPSEGTSLAGKDRINEHKTDYSGYPKAKKGTDPKEIVIGVGAAFQKEIKRGLNEWKIKPLKSCLWLVGAFFADIILQNVALIPSILICPD